MISVTDQPIDPGAELARFAAGRRDVGAVCSLTGLVRAENLVSLTLEHYPGMTEAELARITAQARQRWALLDARVVHRYGRMLPGEPIVFVATAATHRREAFEAASFVMDWLKTSAPFWKFEQLVDGSCAWVDAKQSDNAAADRWR